MNKARIAVFGEVLFDLFPDGASVLGGAPFNIAWHLQAFGESPRFISRIGNDDEGEQIVAAMRDWGMRTDSLQRDSKLPSGRVSVTLEDGQPSYDIVHPCAYDAIDEPGLASESLLYHGSLALRSAQTRAAFDTLRDDSRSRIFFDVNLRSPWWNKTDLLSWLRQASWVKLNDEELALLGPTGKHDDAAVEAMFERNQLDGLIVTYGAEGAALRKRNEPLIHMSPDHGVAVVDTVGAGDAFAAVCLLGILREWSSNEIVSRAQAFASRVVGQRGATSADKALYDPFISAWSL